MQGFCEAETATMGNATRLGKGIQAIESIQPETFKDLGKIGEINENVIQAVAMLQGSITNQQMLENVTKMVSGVLLEIQQVRKESAGLKRQLSMRGIITAIDPNDRMQTKLS